MSVTNALDPRTSVWDLVAVQLRLLRLRHGWTCEQVGEVANASRSHVSNWEAGRRRPRLANVVPLDDAWDTGGLLATLIGYAMDGHDHPRVGSFLEFERTAVSIKYYGDDVVYGLFQTENYARALFHAGGAVDDIDAAVVKRMERQRWLDEANAPHLWVVLAQSVLWWQVGEPQVMREQLGHLLDISRHPRVSLRVLPVLAGWPGISGSLSIMTTRGAEVAYLEAGRMGKVIERFPEVQEMCMLIDGIGARAFPEDQSRALIEHMRGRLK